MLQTNLLLLHARLQASNMQYDMDLVQTANKDY